MKKKEVSNYKRLKNMEKDNEIKDLFYIRIHKKNN